MNSLPLCWGKAVKQSKYQKISKNNYNFFLLMLMLLYFQSSGCIDLLIGKKIQGVKFKVSALPHCPLYIAMPCYDI